MVLVAFLSLFTKSIGNGFFQWQMLEAVYGYIAHIKSWGDESKDAKRSRRKKDRRWVVERTYSWLNRFRRILIRWEKTTKSYRLPASGMCLFYLCQIRDVRIGSKSGFQELIRVWRLAPAKRKAPARRPNHRVNGH
jgi:hypothetical protein